VGIASVGPDLTDLLATARWGPDALAAADVLRVVAGASLVYGLYFMLVSAVFLRRRTVGLPLLTLAAGAANVAANLLLVPRIGIIGAAWSTLAGYAVLTGLTWWYAARGFPVRLDLVRLGLIGGAAAGTMLLARFVPPDGASGSLTVVVHLALAAGFAALMLPIVHEPVARLRRLLAAPPAGRPLPGTPVAGG
jgi:O-antigen/teichoic acid export membrane protein